MRIGPHQFSGPFFLAPLAGVSDRPFRAICRMMGAASAYTEMVSAHGLIQGNRQTWSYLDHEPDEAPFAVQIFAAEPEALARGAEIVVERGAGIVDLNMACPVRKVCGSGAGAALARDPRAVERAVSAVVAVAGPSVPVTVKIRSGWDQRQLNCIEVARAAEAGGASAVAVHGRTRAQMYSGKADWSQIRAVQEAVRVPVLGSGDVWTASDALRMRAETGCAAVLVARGACGNPWIFRELAAAAENRPSPPPPSREEWMELVLHHVELQIAHRRRQLGDGPHPLGPERLAIREIRKHLLWYTRGLQGGAHFRREVDGLESLGDVRALIERHFPAGTTGFEHKPDRTIGDGL